MGYKISKIYDLRIYLVSSGTEKEVIHELIISLLKNNLKIQRGDYIIFINLNCRGNRYLT